LISEKGGSAIGQLFHTFANKLSSWLTWFGIMAALEHTFVKMAFGFYIVHPAVFVGSIVSAILVRYSADKFSETSILAEIDKVTDYFSMVTSNLEAYYLSAC